MIGHQTRSVVRFLLLICKITAQKYKYWSALGMSPQLSMALLYRKPFLPLKSDLSPRYTSRTMGVSTRSAFRPTHTSMCVAPLKRPRAPAEKLQPVVDAKFLVQNSLQGLGLAICLFHCLVTMNVVDACFETMPVPLQCPMSAVQHISTHSAIVSIRGKA